MHSNIDIHSSSVVQTCPVQRRLLQSEPVLVMKCMGKSVQQLSEGNKELECMSIQCDVWRSKFTASRLIINYILIRGGRKEGGARAPSQSAPPLKLIQY